MWVGVRPAGEVIPGLDRDALLHTGPPLRGEPPPLLQRALAGALLFEGRAGSLEEAVALVPRMRLASCNDHRAVAPLGGAISSSMPVLVVRDAESGVEAYSPLNEGGGCVLRFGCVKDEVVTRLRSLADEVAPALDGLLEASGVIDVYELITGGLHLGDDCHHRFRGVQLSLSLALQERVDRLGWPLERRKTIVDAVAKNDYFPLNLVMAASKAAALAAEGVPGSSLLTAIARNGVETGVRVSGLPGRWFTAPVEPVEATPLDPADPAEGHPDTGDSCIVEVNGLGAFALPAAPTLARWFGGTQDALVELCDEMRRIAVGEHPLFTIPSLGFRGTPVGIDCERCVELGVSPGTETLLVTLERHPHAAAIGLSRVPLAALEAATAALRSAERAPAA